MRSSTLVAFLATGAAARYIHRVEQITRPSFPHLIKPHLVARDDEVCTSPSCQLAAENYLANFPSNYTEMDPCENFDQMICGGWLDKNDFRPDQATIGIGSTMSEEADNILRVIMENPYATNSTPAGVNATLDRENFDKMQSAYKACVDLDAIKAAGAAPLQEIVNELQEKFPLNAATKSTAAISSGELTDIMIWMAQYGLAPFVSAGTAADDKNPDTVIVSVGPGATTMAKQYYNNTAFVGNLTMTMAAMFSAILDNATDYTELAAKVVDLEGRIATVEPDPEIISDVTYYYNPMTLAEADALVPAISLTSLIKAQAPASYEPEFIIVQSPDYLKDVTPILESAPRDTLQALFMWSVISSFGGRIDKDINQPLRAFRNFQAGRPANATSDRWRTCLDEVDSVAGWIESEAYVQRAFSPEAKTFGDEIVQSLRDVYADKLQSLDWMGNDTKRVAIEKVKALNQKIGYPTISPNVLDPVSLRDFYANLTLSSASFFANGLSATTFELARTWAQLLAPADKEFWFMTASTVNAYYNPSSNEIAFPAGIMQQPVFDLDLPEYVSYGAFGSVAGHEITHAFDDSGRYYDQTGAFSEWWDNKTLASFTQRTQCFVDQYSEFAITGLDGAPLNVNGQLTLGENIADAGGVAASFEAWKMRDQADPARNKALPGLEFFTKDQMFFVSYATWWCGRSRLETAVNRIYTDPHSPPMFRIRGTLENSKAFLESFQCAKKEPKCELW
ncbi:endothelin-converting enzyme [Aulographum hederae CBS 113979]|uniref:Endothelin-converting enzyme n=1 Tax=Aulographum hederae CBS 113979 TaxID=1176131 RepID=A0A6G1GJE3_9PEZI|nr:endothelin-converting enzyme [Aulographum hederae CBS 113979]